MKILKPLTTIMVATIALGGCSTASKNISAASVSPMMFQSYDCEQLASEAQRLHNRANQLGGRLDEAASNDAGLMAVGLLIYWPALLHLGGTKQQEAEYARLKGEHDAVYQSAIIKKCSGVIANQMASAPNTAKETGTVKEVGLGKEIGETAPPKLSLSASIPSADGSVELSGQVGGNVTPSKILLNGSKLEALPASDGSFKVTRFLPVGVTTYRLSVFDESGQRADAMVTVERRVSELVTESPTQLDPRKIKAKANPNAIALIIGVESYARLPPAQYADSDANHFYDYANQSLGVPPNKIKLLTDSKANRTEILKAMRNWMKTEVINGKSDVYIFFAGHGLASADGSKTYLLPADGDRDLLDETSILRDDLIASANGAKTITMFLDTCYSGGTRTNEVLLADARPIAIVPEMKLLPSNVTVLAAASGAQLSSTYEAAQQGLFSYWLMKGLEGDADTNKDKKITAGELHEYVAKQVGPMAQTRNRQQNPQLMGESQRVLVRLN